MAAFDENNTLVFRTIRVSGRDGFDIENQSIAPDAGRTGILVLKRAMGTYFHAGGEVIWKRKGNEAGGWR
jgi:hypothetical protein